jgi:hypothetical protein
VAGILRLSLGVTAQGDRERSVNRQRDTCDGLERNVDRAAFDPTHDLPREAGSTRERVLGHASATPGIGQRPSDLAAQGHDGGIRFDGEGWALPVPALALMRHLRHANHVRAHGRLLAFQTPPTLDAAMTSTWS